MGLQYTAQFSRGGNLNVLFGQSYQLFGRKSFAVADLTNTGLGTGLDKTASDYVGRVAFQPNQFYTLSSRFRFDSETFALQRLELEASTNFDRWNVSILYGDYAAEPQRGFLTRRDGILTSGAYKLNQNWVVNGGIRYDIEAGKPSQYRLGLGYIDDCFIVSFQYYTDYTLTSSLTSNQTYMLQISLRTLGGTETH